MTADECKNLMEMREQESRKLSDNFKNEVNFKDFQSFKQVD